MDTLESSELALQAKAPAALQLEEATGAEWASLRPATNSNKGGGAQGRVGELAARRAGGKATTTVILKSASHVTRALGGGDWEPNNGCDVQSKRRLTTE